jgi:hypothetical protein
MARTRRASAAAWVAAPTSTVVPHAVWSEMRWRRADTTRTRVEIAAAHARSAPGRREPSPGWEGWELPSRVKLEAAQLGEAAVRVGGGCELQDTSPSDRRDQGGRGSECMK